MPQKKVLQRLDKEELVTLLDCLVQRDSSLAAAVSMAASSVRGKAPSAAAVQRELKRVFKHDNPGKIEAGLQFVMRLGQNLAENGAYAGAGEVYCAVLESLTDHSLRCLLDVDHDGELGFLAEDCVKGIASCLVSGAIEPRARLRWLTSLKDATLADVEWGCIDYAYGAWDAILDHAQDEEWEVIQASIRKQMPCQKKRKQALLVGMLVAWEERHGRHENARQIIQEFGPVKELRG